MSSWPWVVVGWMRGRKPVEAGQWVLYYPDDTCADTFGQVRIVAWVDARHGAVVRHPSGREEEVPAYKLSPGFVMA